jgi:hypothetical protein
MSNTVTAAKLRRGMPAETYAVSVW